jgi:hypothetical protein
MHRYFTIPMLTSYGPAEVFFDRQVAEALLPILEEFLEKDKEILDLVRCERCNTYVVVITNHGCEGVQ